MDKKGEVIKLSEFRQMEGDNWGENAQEFADQVKSGEVTHGVMIYRTTNGDIHWRAFCDGSGTYVLGLLTRLIFLINQGE